MQCLPTKLAGSTHWALKFRSYVTIMGSTYGRCLPEAKSFFLYRSLIPWLKSYIRMLGGGDIHAPFYQPYVSFLGSIVPQLSGRTEVPLLEVALCAWIGSMEAAVEMQSSGQQLCCLRYEELAREPIESVTAVARFCGFGEPNTESLAKAVQQDSQEGSTLVTRRVGRNQGQFRGTRHGRHQPIASQAFLPGIRDNGSSRHVFPFVTGKRPSDIRRAGDPVYLKLEDFRQSDTGVVVNTYRPCYLDRHETADTISWCGDQGRSTDERYLLPKSWCSGARTFSQGLRLLSGAIGTIPGKIERFEERLVLPAIPRVRHERVLPRG